MKPRPKESERHVAAVTTALKILDCFKRDDGLQLKDLHHRTGLNKSRILRFVGSLEACGFLVFDEDRSEYMLGPKLYYLGRVIEKQYLALIDGMRPTLRDLASETGSVAYFSVRRGFDRLVLLRIQPNGIAEDTVKDGQVRPIHLGANGRVLLAFDSAKERGKVLQYLRKWHELGLSPQAYAELEERLTATRQDGHAIAFGETKPRHFVVSVPLLTSERRRLVGALALSTPGLATQPMWERASRYVELLTQASAELEAVLADAMPPL